MFGKTKCNLLGLLLLFIFLSLASFADNSKSASAVNSDVTISCSSISNNNIIINSCVLATSPPITQAVHKAVAPLPGLSAIPERAPASGIEEPTPGQVPAVTTPAATIYEAALSVSGTGLTTRAPEVSSSLTAYIPKDPVNLPISASWPESTRLVHSERQHNSQTLDDTSIGSADDSLVEHPSNSNADDNVESLTLEELRWRYKEEKARSLQVEEERARDGLRWASQLEEKNKRIARLEEERASDRRRLADKDAQLEEKNALLRGKHVQAKGVNVQMDERGPEQQQSTQELDSINIGAGTWLLEYLDSGNIVNAIIIVDLLEENQLRPLIRHLLQSRSDSEADCVWNLHLSRAHVEDLATELERTSTRLEACNTQVDEELAQPQTPDDIDSRPEQQKHTEESSDTDDAAVSRTIAELRSEIQDLTASNDRLEQRRARDVERLEEQDAELEEKGAIIRQLRQKQNTGNSSGVEPHEHVRFKHSSPWRLSEVEHDYDHRMPRKLRRRLICAAHISLALAISLGALFICLLFWCIYDRVEKKIQRYIQLVNEEVASIELELSSVPTSIQQGLPSAEAIFTDPTLAQQYLTSPTSEAFAADQDTQQEDTAGPISEVLVVDSTAVEQVVVAPSSEALLSLKETCGCLGEGDNEEEVKASIALAEVKVSSVVHVDVSTPNEADIGLQSTEVEISSGEDEDVAEADDNSPADVNGLVEAEADLDLKTMEELGIDWGEDSDDVSGRQESLGSGSHSASDGNEDEASGEAVARSEQARDISSDDATSSAADVEQSVETASDVESNSDCESSIDDETDGDISSSQDDGSYSDSDSYSDGDDDGAAGGNMLRSAQQAGNADSSADVERSPVAERDSCSHSDRESSVDEERHSNTASQREEASSSSDSDGDADGEDDDGTPGEAIVQSIQQAEQITAPSEELQTSPAVSQMERLPTFEISSLSRVVRPLPRGATSRTRQQAVGSAASAPYISSPLSANTISSDALGNSSPPELSPGQSASAVIPEEADIGSSTSSQSLEAQAPVDSPVRPVESDTVRSGTLTTLQSESSSGVSTGPSANLQAPEPHAQQQQLEQQSIHDAVASSEIPSVSNEPPVHPEPSALTHDVVTASSSDASMYGDGGLAQAGVSNAALVRQQHRGQPEGSDPGQLGYPAASSSFSQGQMLPATYAPAQQYHQGLTEQQATQQVGTYQQYQNQQYQSAPLPFFGQRVNWQHGMFQEAQRDQTAGQASLAFAAPQYSTSSSGTYPSTFGQQNAPQASPYMMPQYTTAETSFNPYLHVPDHPQTETPQSVGLGNVNSGTHQDVAVHREAGAAPSSEASRYPALMDIAEEPHQAGDLGPQEQEQQFGDTFTAEQIAYLHELEAQQNVPALAPQQQHEYNAAGTQVAQPESGYAPMPVVVQTELAPRLVQPVYRLPIEAESPVLPAGEPFEFDVDDNFTLQDAQDALAAHVNVEGAAAEFDWNNVDPLLRPDLAAPPVNDAIVPQNVDQVPIGLPAMPNAPHGAVVEQGEQIDPALAQLLLPAADEQETPEQLEQSLDFITSVVASFQADDNPSAARFDLFDVDPQAGPLDQLGAQFNAWYSQQQTELILWGEVRRLGFESAYYAEIEPANAPAGPSTQPLSVPAATAGGSSQRKRRTSDRDVTEAASNTSNMSSAVRDTTQALRPLPRRAMQRATLPAAASAVEDRSVLAASPMGASAMPSEPEQVFVPQSDPATPPAETSTTQEEAPVVEVSVEQVKLGKRPVPLDDNLDSGRYKLTRAKDDEDVSTASSPPASPLLGPRTPSTVTSETLVPSTASSVTLAPSTAGSELSPPTTPTQERPVRPLSAKARGKRPARTASEDEAD